MKYEIKIICILILGFSLSNNAQGQLTVNDMNVPTSPGLILIDKAPSSIDKPANPKAFGIDIFNFFTKNEGAIDVTPFWLCNHPKLDFMHSVKNNSPIIETINLSFAGSKTDSGSYLTAGFRTIVFRGYSKNKLSDIINKRQEIIDALSNTPDQLDESKLKKLGKEMGTLRSEATFCIEIAAAIAGFSKDNSFSNLGNNKYGAWFNIHWHPYYKIPLSLTGVARFTNAPNSNTLDKKDSSYVDYGIAGSYQKDNLDLQLEYVKRNDINHNQTYDHTTLVANYMVADNIVLVASLGKDYSSVQNILVIFGVKFGVSKQRVN